MIAAPRLTLFNRLVVWGDVDEVSIEASGPRCEVLVNDELKRVRRIKPRNGHSIPLTVEAECLEGETFTEAVCVAARLPDDSEPASGREIRSLLNAVVAARAVDPFLDPLERWTALQRVNGLCGTYYCGQPITYVRFKTARQEKVWNTTAGELDADLHLAREFKANASSTSLPENAELEVHVSNTPLPVLRLDVLPDLVQPCVRDLAGFQFLVATRVRFGVPDPAAGQHLTALWGNDVHLRKSRPGWGPTPLQLCPSCGRTIRTCNAYHHGQAGAVPALHEPGPGSPALYGLCRTNALRRLALDPVPLKLTGQPMANRLARINRDDCWRIERQALSIAGGVTR